METRKLGTIDVSIVGLGCNNFGRRLDADQAATVVQAALDHGINFFDTADVYGDGLSESYLGQALGDRRSEVLVATKFGYKLSDNGSGGASPEWIGQAVRDSLDRLGTDHIDLYQLHTPDADTPIDATLGALTELVDEGLVLNIGCSNFSAEQIEGSFDAAERGSYTSFASVQNEYSLLHRQPEDDVLQATKEHEMAFLPYFPLASGMLTGKYRKGVEPDTDTRLGGLPADRASRFLNEGNLRIVEDLIGFAQARSRTVLELAFSWLATRPTVASVIAGATKAEQVAANVAAAGWAISTDEAAEVDSITLS